MEKVKLVITFLFLIGFSINLSAQKKHKLEKMRVLVYTKNGKGYVHDNRTEVYIPAHADHPFRSS